MFRFERRTRAPLARRSHGENSAKQAQRFADGLLRSQSAKEDATRVGLMRHGRLAHTLTAAELSHTDLEKLYLETMRA